MRPCGIQVREQVAALEQSRALALLGRCYEARRLRGSNCRAEKWVWLSCKHTLAQTIATTSLLPNRDLRSPRGAAILDYAPCVHILARR